jgi:hypothetical protein
MISKGFGLLAFFASVEASAIDLMGSIMKTASG